MSPLIVGVTSDYPLQRTFDCQGDKNVATSWVHDIQPVPATCHTSSNAAGQYTVAFFGFFHRDPAQAVHAVRPRLREVFGHVLRD